jgi:HAE1 family hydrophobic/amphiphilic exporter-1
MQVEVDRQRASDLGLSPAQIASTVRLLVNGEVATTFHGEGDDADIRVQLDASERADADDILAINILSPSGQLVPLRNVAQISMAVGPNQIRRVDRQPTITVEANVIGRSAPSAVTEVSELLASLQLPEAVDMRMGGSAQDSTEAFGSLLLALGLAVIFIYMVLASQFASLVQPLLIMLALPLAIIGAILALLIAGKPLDMTAFIGFIMLMGLATKNSILLVDFANRARAKGDTADAAMRAAGPVRLRPILMTSLSMILAMIPIALGYSAGGEFRQSMAIAIMGGMISSTFLTLIIVPLGYGSVVGLQDRLAARRARRRMEKAPERASALRQGIGSPDPLPSEQPLGD